MSSKRRRERNAEKQKERNTNKEPGRLAQLWVKITAPLARLWAKIDWHDPAWIFLTVVILAGLFIIYKVLPRDIFVFYDRLMKVTVETQNTKLTNLDQPPELKASDTFFVDTIDFPGGNDLRHERIGGYPYSSDFFMTIEGEFEVLTAGTYKFFVSSDDGFRLTVDDTILCEFTGDRPLPEPANANEGEISLKTGRHPFVIKHFQGFGQLGLQAWYSGPGCERRRMGEHSACLRFIEQPKLK
ncbi:MAG: hypothetical protein LBC99_09580 [Spirochaetota bacterium]|jgi:hypothetical protein|nr:hypothetical protein [Spirochaetota bacterium]